MPTRQLLTDATATGAGVPFIASKEQRAFHAWLGSAGGTAEVVIEVSNDSRAGSDPANASWLSQGIISLSGVNNADGYTSEAPWEYVRARVNSIAGGAVVNAVMSKRSS
jgi:hypothetical protein